MTLARLWLGNTVSGTNTDDPATMAISIRVVCSILVGAGTK
jgi:hypothetical protein